MNFSYFLHNSQCLPISKITQQKLYSNEKLQSKDIDELEDYVLLW